MHSDLILALVNLLKLPAMKVGENPSLSQCLLDVTIMMLTLPLRYEYSPNIQRVQMYFEL